MGKQRFNWKVSIIALAVVLVFSLLLWAYVLQPKEKPLLIGLTATPASALIQVAQEKGFFEKNGLNVEIRDFTAGAFAFQAFLANSVDFAVSADVPPLLARLQGNDFLVLAQVSETSKEAAFVINDDGSNTLQEYFLKSKRKLAVTLGSTSDFSTFLFLKHFGIPKEQVEIIAQKPEEMVGALSSNSVDAIAAFEPYASLAEEVLLGKTRRFHLPPEVYPTIFVLTANKDWIAKNPEKTKRLLKSLKESEEFVKNNPEEAQKIVAKHTKFQEGVIQKSWEGFDFKVSLPQQQLLKNWESQKEWAIETGIVKQIANGDFSGLLAKEGFNDVESRQ